MARLRPVEHDDRLTLVEHLDEFRTRIFLALGSFLVALGVCFWQDQFLFDIANKALPDGLELLTLSPVEPFLTTITVAAYGALVVSLPFILYQAFAFALPALTESERSAVIPFAIACPFLFLAGVALGYFVVMPVAIDFLFTFNADNFNTQLRALDYYGFFGLVLVSLGLTFQMPLLILAVVRLQLVTPEQITAQWRYAVVLIAVISAALPGGDPVSMFLILFPLLALFGGSLALARYFDPRKGTPDEPAKATR